MSEDEIKGPLPSFAFWTSEREQVLSDHRARSGHYYADLRDGSPYRVVGLCATIHRYVVAGYADGVAAEMRAAVFHGATRGDLLDTLSLAFIYAGHPGMSAVAEVARRELPDDGDGDPNRFPPGWVFAPERLDSGMDRSDSAVGPEDLGRLSGWYRRTLGEVPEWVQFLAEHRPGLLKTHRLRYERAVSASLPVQMVPYILLRHHVITASGDGIRENVLLGQSLGLTRVQLLDAVSGAVLHAGGESLGLVARVAGDLLTPGAGPSAPADT